MVVLSAIAIGFLVLCTFGAAYVVFFAVAGRIVRAPRGRLASAEYHCFLVLVPAHNEAADILPTLHSLAGQDYPLACFRIVVIADNCTDLTADVVRSAGFTCWERQDPDHRGKGFALQWAIERAGTDFDVVFVVDADSQVSPNTLTLVNDRIAAGAGAVQVRYSFAPSSGSPFQAITYVSKLAETNCFCIPRSRLGLTVLIQGNGFALTREALKAAPWRSHSIVEDVEHTIDLVLRGIRVDFEECAEVVARQPQTVSDAVPQRIRWASGTFTLIGAQAWRMFTAGIRTADWRLVEGAIALIFTSRVLLVYLFTAGLMLTPLLRGEVLRVAIALLGLALVLQFLYFALIMSASARSGETLKAVLVTPAYIAWLAFIHILSLSGIKRGVWSRTVR